ncbi:hypothetical protein Lfu02_40100 [Longispora fulva]|uniref:Transglutaminase-like domain-containing protein n=1 Tax=Longispora fulva TaxID=619741 RepID=A0A8J7KFP9_9ACTN|nr:transglutaminase-like domain-containing protein [Longispora fulva]MBG6136470.1 hypothetical protein [Longispora fulva]GIG59638.1 hypothetical protein Lfu02_40100 [Longispora fulva]
MVEGALDELRQRAQDLGRAERWAELWQLVPQLREDTELWPGYWGPLSALAGRFLGLAEGRAVLDEVIAAGFHQPELMEPFFTAAFGADPDWALLKAVMAANLPAPAVTLLDWPTITPTAPLELCRLPNGREPELAARMPAVAASSWQTARELLRWVSTMWVHSDLHVDGTDGLEILDRVRGGERFACREYTLLLTQTLNAAGIPARQVNVFTRTAHAGFGGGHLVSEAWIDDLGAWVLLDGQNGLYWTDEDGTPLGTLALQARFQAGGSRPHAVCLGAVVQEHDLQTWWGFFGDIRITGGAWGEQVVPILGGAFIATPRLLRAGPEAYPDLSELAVSVAVIDGEPAVCPHSDHPFVTGFRVNDHDLAPGEAWPLPRSESGEHVVELAAVGRYGPLTVRRLRYRVAA